MVLINASISLAVMQFYQMSSEFRYILKLLDYFWVKSRNL